MSTVISETAIVVIYGGHLIDDPLLATLVSNMLAITPAYHLNRRWAWGKRGRSHWRKEVLPYLAMSFTGSTFSLLGGWWARHEVRTHTWGHLFNTGFVAGMNLASFAIFWVLKMMLFNRIFRTTSVEDFDAHLTQEERASRGSS